MDDEIQLFRDGDGLAVLGDPAAVERFLASEGLPAKGPGTRRLGAALGDAAGAARAGADLAADAGRWVKLSEESARRIDRIGLGIERDQEALEARRWKEAAVEVRDRALEKGAENLDAARRLGTETFDRARSATGRLSGGLAERAFRQRGGDAEG